ncbi:hypothetical protein ACXOL9_004725 [Vibrio parahaemolyticus]
MSITITHSSPRLITEIKPFGGCANNGTLFFSTNDYVMATCDVVFYDMQLSDEEIVSVSQLYDGEIIAEISERIGCDAALAESLLDESVALCETEFYDADDDWWIQGKSAECAQKMGYVAAKGRDENGTIYMIKMNNELLTRMTLREE